jgi:hypothetical protein
MKTEVFLCSSPAHFPLSFASHTWLVIVEDETLTRYEVLHRKNKKDTSIGHLFINRSNVFEGLGILIGFPWKWKRKILAQIKGEKAKKMIEIIKSSEKNYPHKKIYSLIGPNSNTYIQWCLNQFPEWEIKLPKNAFGKNFEKK